MRARPSCAASHAADRSPSGSPLWSTTTPTAPKRARSSDSSCGVRLISGTSIRTWARSSARSRSSIARRYTSVLPLPVMPNSRWTPNPCAATSASTAACCWAVRRCSDVALDRASDLALAQPRQRLREARPRRRPQHRRQRRQRNLSPRMLVVVGRELREVEPVAIERPHLVDDEADILQASRIDVGPVGGVDDQSHPGSPPDGDDAHLPGQCVGSRQPIVKGLRQRDIDDDAGKTGSEGRRHGHVRREGVSLSP